MHPTYLAVLGLLLAACGGQSVMRPPGSFPPPNGNPFTLEKEPFSLTRGGSAPLTVRVTFISSEITRVRLEFVPNTLNLLGSPREQDLVRGSTSVQTTTFTISDGGIDPQEKRPFFYIYAKACINNNCSSQKSIPVQWDMP
ncbi:hypothetical protein [Meiothermus sp.]|jgi:hypothetical protein|uniref:hypothetical protein n=1 Tax=Meiothermus sp. TaxID=1955249 RepID=UPI0021DEBE83|nr:hypothetical protein [Meiothermus sp.]GIW25643.1 MAG: hypothetical protein KatS3mg069_1910 [Meiothermus sp.]